MCRCSEEDVEYLLIHFEGLPGYGVLLLEHLGVPSILPKRVVDVLVEWRNWLGRHSSGFWNLVLPCAMWIIWRQHNNCIFEDLECSGDQLIALFAGTLFDWSCAWGSTSSDSILLLIDSNLSYIISFLLISCTYRLGCFILFI